MKKATNKFEHMLRDYFAGGAGESGLFAEYIKQDGWEHRLPTMELAALIAIAIDARIPGAEDLAGEDAAEVRAVLIPQLVKLGRTRQLDATIATISGGRKTKAGEGQQELALEWFFQSPAPTRWMRAWPIVPTKLPADGRATRQNYVIASTKWAEVAYHGTELDANDIKILFAFLSLVHQRVGGDLALIAPGRVKFTGRIGEALGVMGKSDTEAAYNRVRDSLIRWGMVTLVYRDKKNDAETMHKVLHLQSGKPLKGEITFEFDDYFYKQMIERGGVQYLDIKRFCALNAPAAVMLCGFVESQAGPSWIGQWRTISDVLNLPVAMPDKEKRRRIKEAIAELVEKGWLTEGSGWRGKAEVILIKPRKKVTQKSEN